MTSAQWTVLNEIRALLPDATVTLQAHRLTWKRDSRLALPPVCTTLVVKRVGPLTFRREYEAPDS